MSCFSRQTGNFNVTNVFLTTFHYVEKWNGILRKNRGEGFEKSYVPLHWDRGGVKNFQNHPYIINEWPLSCETCLNKLALLLLFQMTRILYFTPCFLLLPSKGWRYLSLAPFSHNGIDVHGGTFITQNTDVRVN